MHRRNSESRYGGLEDIHQKMVDETSEFLTWALSEDRRLPRIPRKRVDQGGFRELLAVPGAKKLVHRWWNRILGGQWD